MLTNLLLPDVANIHLNDIQVDTDGVRLQVTTTAPSASCPKCGDLSERIHSRYERQVQDLPWSGLPVRIRLIVRRFFCDNLACPQKTFTESLGPTIHKYGRRTRRMNEQLKQIAFALGGQAGKPLAERLGLPTSASTLLRVILSTELTERETPRILGIDDWGQRKGATYGTILVDLEKHHIVDVLPDRTTETVAQWLRDHPGVEIVSRDRSDAYAEGIRQGAPDAIHVADRWHLLKNLTDAVYKILQKHQASIEKMLGDDRSIGELPAATADLGSETQRAADQETFSAAALARQKRVTEAHRLHQEGWSNQAIAAPLGVCPKTVGRYLNLELPLVPLRRSGHRRFLDPYTSYIVKRWNAGCYNAAQLYRELQAQGFVGHITIVRDFVRQLRATSGVPPRVRHPSGAVVRQDPSERRPSLRALAYLIGRSPDKWDDSDKTLIARLGAVNPKLERVIRLARAFATMVRQRSHELLDNWLDDARDSWLSSFAAGLRQDKDAVKAALSLSWSNGPTEGHINRLKFVKRQMYGRGSFELLRRKLLWAA